MIDARTEASLGYSEDAARLRTQAREALRSGFSAWYYELVGLAVIAERAAKAEIVDREPVKR